MRSMKSVNMPRPDNAEQGAVAVHTTKGERFVDSLLEQDWENVGRRLNKNARYRAITSSKVTEVTGREQALSGMKIIF